MKWDSYEKVIASIYAFLGSQTGVIIECSGRNCKRIGSSGTVHQIDVLAAHTDGAHTYRTTIEAKYLNKKVEKRPVVKAAFIREDCNFDKAIVVTNVGFTPDSVKVARAKNVCLVELKEHQVIISGKSFVKYFANMELTEGKIHKIEYFLDESERSSVAMFNPEGKDWKTFHLDKPDGTNPILKDVMLPFEQKLKDGDERYDMQESVINFEPGTTINIPGIQKNFLINGIVTTGYRLAYTQLDQHYFQGKTWLLMKLLFEEKQFVYTMDGQVEPLAPSVPIQLVVGQTVKIRMVPRMIKYTITPNPALETHSGK